MKKEEKKLYNEAKHKLEYMHFMAQISIYNTFLKPNQMHRHPWKETYKGIIIEQAKVIAKGLKTGYYDINYTFDEKKEDEYRHKLWEISKNPLIKDIDDRMFEMCTSSYEVPTYSKCSGQKDIPFIVPEHKSVISMLLEAGLRDIANELIEASSKPIEKLSDVKENTDLLGSYLSICHSSYESEEDMTKSLYLFFKGKNFSDDQKINGINSLALNGNFVDTNLKLVYGLKIVEFESSIPVNLWQTFAHAIKRKNPALANFLLDSKSTKWDCRDINYKETYFNNDYKEMILVAYLQGLHDIVRKLYKNKKYDITGVNNFPPRFVDLFDEIMKNKDLTFAKEMLNDILKLYRSTVIDKQTDEGGKLYVFYIYLISMVSKNIISYYSKEEAPAIIEEFYKIFKGMIIPENKEIIEKVEEFRINTNMQLKQVNIQRIHDTLKCILNAANSVHLLQLVEL
jgi:hypothetical protein